MVPKKCQDCQHMGNYGHGEPPPCSHPGHGRKVYEDFANPRGEPPTWCPLRETPIEVWWGGRAVENLSREELIDALVWCAGEIERLKRGM